jgi:4-hydroxybenzoyl-CoA thioesterase
MTTAVVSQAHSLLFRIYLEDTDAGGVVYHASYLRFMERARTEMLRSTGLEQSQTFKSDVSFVVHSMNLRFHAPALLDAQVLTTCELAKVSGASLVFRQQVRCPDTGTVYVSAEVTVACIQLTTRRPRRIPEALLNALQQHKTDELSSAASSAAVAVDR